MKKFIITIIPAIALLAGCGKVPLACESDDAKNAVQRIISKTTNIPTGLYSASFEQVITQSINDKKEQTCKATVTYSLTEEAKNTLIEATVKLDESLVVHPGGYPTTKFLVEQEYSYIELYDWKLPKSVVVDILKAPNRNSASDIIEQFI